jgi:transcriptional regulator with XRE-family HTH domain
MKDSNIGERLRAAREALGLSQAEVSEKMQLERSTIAKKETGDRGTTPSELAQFAEIYNQPVTYFFEESSGRAVFSDGDRSNPFS